MTPSIRAVETLPTASASSQIRTMSSRIPLALHHLTISIRKEPERAVFRIPDKPGHFAIVGSFVFIEPSVQLRDN